MGALVGWSTYTSKQSPCCTHVVSSQIDKETSANCFDGFFETQDSRGKRVYSLVKLRFLQTMYTAVLTSLTAPQAPMPGSPSERVLGRVSQYRQLR